MSLTILIRPDGDSQAIYDETLDLRSLGSTLIQRASHVEPSKEGLWYADLSPVGGPKLGPFDLRTKAIKAEIFWLNQWLLSNCKGPKNSTS